MSQKTATTRSTSAEVRRVISSLPQELLRRHSTDAVLSQIGLAILGKISQAFAVKSVGGTDEAGDRWAPLSPKTVAYGRVKRGKRESARSERPSQALTKKQQAQWWELYSQGLAMYKGNKASAAKRAWTIMKGRGAVTLVGKYGGRRVPILNDSGQLLASLTPGSGSPHQILRVQRGNVTFGTSRSGAAAHHAGSSSRGLPQRRLWPPTENWPASWWREITREVQTALVDLIMDGVK